MMPQVFNQHNQYNLHFSSPTLSVDAITPPCTYHDVYKIKAVEIFIRHLCIILHNISLVKTPKWLTVQRIFV